MLAWLVDWLWQDEALAPLWLPILFLAALYLVLLGLTCLFKPKLAKRFFLGFAQSHGVNALEAGLRFFVGLAFIGGSNGLAGGSFFLPQLIYRHAPLVGLFLCLSAVAMLLLPGLHRRYANRVVPPFLRLLPLIGVISIVLGMALTDLLPNPVDLIRT